MLLVGLFCLLGVFSGYYLFCGGRDYYENYKTQSVHSEDALKSSMESFSQILMARMGLSETMQKLKIPGMIKHTRIVVMPFLILIQL